MWIDVNASIGNWPYKPLKDSDLKGLLGRMDRFGVQQSVVANLNGLFYKNTHAANEELMQSIRANKKAANRVIPFGIINPTYPGWKKDFHWCVQQGMKGIRLYPQYHDYLPEDEACVELVKMIAQTGMVVALTTRLVDSRQRSWLDVPETAGTAQGEWSIRNFMPLLKQVPKARYLFLNVANGFGVNSEDAPLLKGENILFDTSGRSLHHMPQVLQQFSPTQFAFGTHSPILDYVTGMLRIESMYESEANTSTKNLLRYQNAQRFLSLTKP